MIIPLASCDFSVGQTRIFKKISLCVHKGMGRGQASVLHHTRDIICCAVHSLPGCTWQPWVEEELLGYMLEYCFIDEVGFPLGLCAFMHFLSLLYL